MHVAVLHYHLRRGGVTRVIETAHEALREHDVELLVIAGEAPVETDFPVAVVPGLRYRDEFDLEAAQSLKQEVEIAAVLNKAKTKVDDVKIDILEKVFFKKASAEIQERSFPLLNEVANVLLRNPQLKLVEGKSGEFGRKAPPRERGARISGEPS